MRVLSEFSNAANEQPTAQFAGKRPKRTRDCPRVTVRLSHEDHAKLTELADGMALSVYLRAKALGDVLPRRRAAGLAVKDRAALAKVLGLLGQSRIANNLNQLAYHANIGSLEMDEEAQEQLEETYLLVGTIRMELLRALGKKQ